MIFFYIVYFVVVFVDCFVCFIVLKMLIVEWFFWFIGDVKLLLFVVCELEFVCLY